MKYQEMADDQVLEYVGPFGPAVIGDYLFERAEWIRVHNPRGHLGPSAMSEVFIPSAKAQADLLERGMIEPEKPAKKGKGK